MIKLLGSLKPHAVLAMQRTSIIHVVIETLNVVLTEDIIHCAKVITSELIAWDDTE